jgi:putative FmdB family regulatory protein
VPLYEYQCKKCGKRSERIEKLNGPYLKKCPHCGGDVERLMSAPAIQFKGSGWYVTDYGKSSGGGGSSEKSESGGGSEKGADKSTEKSSDKAAEKSSEKKSESASKKSAAKGK